MIEIMVKVGVATDISFTKDKHMSTARLIIGALASFAAGAVVGILFAPDKGASTRKKLIRESEDALKSVGKKMEESVDEMKVRIAQNFKRPNRENQLVNTSEPEVVR